jgi:hypothetical protein
MNPDFIFENAAACDVAVSLKDSDVLVRRTALSHFHLRHVGWAQVAHEGALQGQG